MADNEEGEEIVPRGNEWEVVSLTASAYAAAPGLKETEVGVDNNGTFVGDEAETSHAMLMSGHFVFPPNQHENLPIEVDIHKENEDEVVVSGLDEEEGSISDLKVEEKVEGSWDIKGFTVADEFSGIQFSDAKESPTLEGLDLIDNEQMYSSPKFSSFHGETTFDESVIFDENSALISELTESSLSVPGEEAKCNRSELPCEAWWKKRAASLYAHAKEANAFWSIFVAAAVMGLVILGQRWQQERSQVLQLRWQTTLSNEVC